MLKLAAYVGVVVVIKGGAFHFRRYRVGLPLSVHTPSGGIIG